MEYLPDLFVIVVCFGSVFGCTLVGIVRGRRTARERAPDQHHMGTIQSAMLGLLGLLLGFAFAGAMSRFTGRQDALAREASAIETASSRADLLPTSDRIRSALREYADLRLLLFEERDRGDTLTVDQLRSRLDAAWTAAVEGSRQAPQFASIAPTGIDAVSEELAMRNALARRHLPLELIGVLVGCSCLAMGTVGYAVGIAERRSIGGLLSLSGLVAVTLFVIMDFDRPRHGLVRLDPTPLREAVARLSKER